ncbi:MAG: hypothetical protein RL648_566 [Verrucomicrobiota bacterium]|jgi:hydroxymethylpyrimidine/phosphomethylpyrimidine kinase
MEIENETPVVLSVAGSDSGGGAGIQADLLTITANGAFGTTAITCLTAQNPDGVSAIEAMPAAFVREQMEQVDRYFNVRVLKTGMLFSSEIIEVVAAFIAARPALKAVVDPVMVATSGAVLLQTEAIEALRTQLLPKAHLVTPNLDEAAVLLGSRPRDVDEMGAAARALATSLQTAVLLKGGHLEAGDELVDILAHPDGRLHSFKNPRLRQLHTHGSGCTLASAIAARMACGSPIEMAIREALTYLHHGMRAPLVLNGKAFIRH